MLVKADWKKWRNLITLLLFLWLVVLPACSGTGDTQDRPIDTTIIGSDNPTPVIDTAGMNIRDSQGK